MSEARGIEAIKADHRHALTRAKDAESAGAFCEKHTPTGGARSTCVICAGERLQSAVSRIDYAMDAPNDMAVSLYDVDFDEQRVIARVQALALECERLREEAAHRRTLRALSHPKVLDILRADWSQWPALLSEAAALIGTEGDRPEDGA